MEMNEMLKQQSSQKSLLNEQFRQYPHQRYSSAYNIRVNHLNKYLLQQHNARIRQSLKSEMNVTSNNSNNPSKNSEIKLHLATKSANSRRINEVFNI